MSDFFHKRGTLTVVIGQGWLSSFEIGSLKVGDVVRTGQLAGRPALIRYNGCEMGPCEVVIIGDLFGVRVTGTEPLGRDRTRAGHPRRPRRAAADRGRTRLDRGDA